MPMEKEAYRDVLEELTTYFHEKRLVTVSDVVRYSGLNRRTVMKRFPFKDGYISIVVLARKLC